MLEWIILFALYRCVNTIQVQHGTAFFNARPENSFQLISHSHSTLESGVESFTRCSMHNSEYHTFSYNLDLCYPTRHETFFCSQNISVINSVLVLRSELQLCDIETLMNDLYNRFSVSKLIRISDDLGEMILWSKCFPMLIPENLTIYDIFVGHECMDMDSYFIDNDNQTIQVSFSNQTQNDSLSHIALVVSFIAILNLLLSLNRISGYFILDWKVLKTSAVRILSLQILSSSATILMFICDPWDLKTRFSYGWIRFLFFCCQSSSNMSIFVFAMGYNTALNQVKENRIQKYLSFFLYISTFLLQLAVFLEDIGFLKFGGMFRSKYFFPFKLNLFEIALSHGIFIYFKWKILHIMFQYVHHFSRSLD